MKVDGIYFKTYLLDTPVTIFERIALEKGILPKYLECDPILDSTFKITEDVNIKTTNIFLKFAKQSRFDFPSDEISSNISRREAEEIFIIYHKVVNEDELLLQFITNVVVENVYFIWDSRVSRLNQFETEFHSFRKKTETSISYFKRFELIEPAQSLVYNETSKRINIFIDQNMAIAEVFNSVITSYYVPYVNFNKFYKIVHNFQIHSGWLEYEIDNAIFLKIDCETKSVFYTPLTHLIPLDQVDVLENTVVPIVPSLTKHPKLYDRYTNAVLIKTKFQERDCLLITADLTVGANNVSKDVFIDRILNAITCIDAKNILQIEETNNTGVVIFPHQTIFIPVWADLCMTNHFFSSVVAIDESIRSSKTRENSYLYVINTPDIITLIMKKIKKPGMYNMEKEGSPYIRTIIKARTYNDALRYQDIINRLFTIYNTEFQNIVDVYRVFLPTFLKDKEIKLQTLKQPDDFTSLKNIAPDIFLPNYSRECAKRPTVVSNQEAALLMETGEKPVMPFPVFGEAEQRWYVCNHESHPYPGLRKNKLENRNKYPFLPCCYIKDQDREGTKLRHYYLQTKLKPHQPVIQDVFLSNKILPPGLAGVLPENLKRLFQIINPNLEYQFLRFGINTNKNSLLEAVMVALNYNNLQFLEPSQRIRVVEKQREVLVQHAEIYAYAAKQELYDYSLDTIISKLKYSNLNVVEVVHVIEQMFDCNIFIFAVNEKNPAGIFVVPPHSRVYIKNVPLRPTVLIYHLERANEFHNELIVQARVDQPKILNNMLTTFTFNGDVVKNIWQIFISITRSFKHSTPIPSSILPYIKPVTTLLLNPTPKTYTILAISQHIDRYGKTRVLNLSMKDENLLTSKITMITDPIPPYSSPVSTKIYRPSLKTVSDLVRILKATVVEQRILKNRCREVVATITSLSIKDPRQPEQTVSKLTTALTIIMLCDDSTHLENVPKTSAVEYENLFQKQSTPLMIYTKNKKLAKLLYQHALYLFSTFLYQNSLSPSDHWLAKWATKYVEINPALFKEIENITTHPPSAAGASRQSDLFQEDILQSNYNDETLLSKSNSASARKKETSTSSEGGTNNKYNCYLEFDKRVPFVKTLSPSALTMDKKFNKILIIPSVGTLKRLVYMIRLYMNTNYLDLVSYYEKKYIENFYVEIDDFTSFPTQFLIEHNPDFTHTPVQVQSLALQDLVYNITSNYKTDLYITKTLRVDSATSYFIYSSIIPNTIFIARNTVIKTPIVEQELNQKIDLANTEEDMFDTEADQSDNEDVYLSEFPDLAENQTNKNAKNVKTSLVLTYFVENYLPLDVAVFIVRFWDKYKFNPTNTELIEAIESNNINDGNVEIYSWKNFQTYKNLTNYISPISTGFIFAYKVDNIPRYTAVMALNHV